MPRQHILRTSAQDDSLLRLALERSAHNAACEREIRAAEKSAAWLLFLIEAENAAEEHRLEVLSESVASAVLRDFDYEEMWPALQARRRTASGVRFP